MNSGPGSRAKTDAERQLEAIIVEFSGKIVRWAFTARKAGFSPPAIERAVTAIGESIADGLQEAETELARDLGVTRPDCR